MGHGGRGEKLWGVGVHKLQNLKDDLRKQNFAELEIESALMIFVIKINALKFFSN